MFNIECRECGGSNKVGEGVTYITCEYCGKQITLPTVQDEERARLYNRANYFRRQGEFDKAIQAFSGIVAQDGADPEATWGRALARFGIEYVQDPRTGERMPTCNRLSRQSILTDSDYLATLENAPDDYTRSLYVQEAQRIAHIQEGILAIANQEEPFDVFICYKETTPGGSRTEDSVLAQDIYERLTRDGLRVFFARITLEDKLGQQYEPYIFAALNSARVMLVVATDAANINAVWVKNEWERFLALMKENRDKVLIPCYRRMNVYDLPEALNVYQSQDMDKLGAMQDLSRGVQKVCEKTRKKDAWHKSAKENTAALLERGFICLRDADFEKADHLFEQTLNLDPHEPNAWLGKLMAERKVCVDDNLAGQSVLLERSANFNHALEYADGDLKRRLEEYRGAVAENVRRRLDEGLDESIRRGGSRYEAARRDRQSSHEDSLGRSQSALAPLEERLNGLRQEYDQKSRAAASVAHRPDGLCWLFLAVFAVCAIWFFSSLARLDALKQQFMAPYQGTELSSYSQEQIDRVTQSGDYQSLKNYYEDNFENGHMTSVAIIGVIMLIAGIARARGTKKNRTQGMKQWQAESARLQEEIDRTTALVDALKADMAREDAGWQNWSGRTETAWSNTRRGLEEARGRLDEGRYDSLIDMEDEINGLLARATGSAA